MEEEVEEEKKVEKSETRSLGRCAMMNVDHCECRCPGKDRMAEGEEMK